MDTVDTELTQLNIADQLRANSSFMKIMATLFHYGNQAMNAAQLVIAVRALNLLPLRGETPKSTIQGIISTSRKIARDLKLSDPFRIDKDGVGRQAKYAIADEILNGVETPEIIEIPDEPIILRPVEYAPSTTHHYTHTKRQRKPSTTYSPTTQLRQNKRKSRVKRVKRKENDEQVGSDVEVGTDDEEYDLTSMGSEEENNTANEIIEEDTIFDYSLLYNPPTSDMDYIDRINFTDYPIAGHFAIVQQKGYSYPRFRSHEKIKIPKVNCEDKFRVTDILQGDTVTGRLFILADGHGGPGCSEHFVRKTPAAVQQLCAEFDPTQLGDQAVQKQLESEIKKLIQQLDDDYLVLKRQQIANKPSPEEHVDNDGCTLILNLFFGEWLINVNVGDSRTVLISAPEPSNAPPTSIENANTLGVDNDYKMDVVFASQDHKPYLEHLARHILENGGEFVDSVQNRVIKVELDKLREDGNRNNKRVALKNARIRPKDYQAGLDRSAALAAQAQIDKVTAAAAQAQADSEAAEKEATETSADQAEQDPANEDTPDTPMSEVVDSKLVPGFAAQSAVRTTANNHANGNHSVPTTTTSTTTTQQQAPAPAPPTQMFKSRIREDRIPSLNVARSCGDLDFKMDPDHKIISCEPDVTFIRISDQPHSGSHTILLNGPHKEKRRHFLFMSTDGTFDYMYEETAERQNRAIAKVIGPMIEDGEKIGKYLLEEEERINGATIEHGKEEGKKEEERNKQDVKVEGEEEKKEDGSAATAMDVDTKAEEETRAKENGQVDDTKEAETKAEEKEKKEQDESINQELEKINGQQEDAKVDAGKNDEAEVDKEQAEDKAEEEKVNGNVSPMDVDVPSATNNEQKEEELPRIPLLYRELTEEESKARKIKERTLVSSARYFANREGAHGFFSSTLQDYDDCTIILVEI